MKSYILDGRVVMSLIVDDRLVEVSSPSRELAMWTAVSLSRDTSKRSRLAD